MTTRHEYTYMIGKSCCVKFPRLFRASHIATPSERCWFVICRAYSTHRSPHLFLSSQILSSIAVLAPVIAAANAYTHAMLTAYPHAVLTILPLILKSVFGRRIRSQECIWTHRLGQEGNAHVFSDAQVWRALPHAPSYLGVGKEVHLW